MACHLFIYLFCTAYQPKNTALLTRPSANSSCNFTVIFKNLHVSWTVLVWRSSARDRCCNESAFTLCEYSVKSRNSDFFLSVLRLKEPNSEGHILNGTTWFRWLFLFLLSQKAFHWPKLVRDSGLKLRPTSYNQSNSELYIFTHQTVTLLSPTIMSCFYSSWLFYTCHSSEPSCSKPYCTSLAL